MESCARNRMILMSILILGICSIEQSEGFFLKNLLPETQIHEEHIPLSGFNQGAFISNTTHIVDEIRKNVSEKLEESSTHIITSVKDIVTSILDDHSVDNLKTTKVPEENNQIDIELKINEIPSVEEAETIVENHEPSDSEVSIVNLPEEDSQDVVTVLEDNIRSSVKDEIQLVQNFESSAIDVIDDIPDPEVRQTLTEDLMAIEYPQSVKKPEDSESMSPTVASIKRDNISLTDLPVEVTTVSTTSQDVTVENLTSLVPSDIESTTANSPLTEETTIITIKVENIHSWENMDDPNEINQILTRQMRGFEEDSGSGVPNRSSDSSDNSSSHSSGLSVNDLLESESSTKDENVSAEETSEEIDKVIPQDTSVEGGFEKEDIPIRETVLPQTLPTRRPYITTTTEAHTIGVGEEYSVSEATDNIMLTNANKPLDVEIPTEMTALSNHNDKGDQIDVATNGRNISTGNNDDILSIYSKDFHVSDKTGHDNLIVDKNPLQNNSRLYTESILDEHNELLLDGSSNIASEFIEVTKDPIGYASKFGGHLKPTLPTPEHPDQDKIIKQSNAVSKKQGGLEIVYAPTFSADFKQELTDELPTFSEESEEGHKITNQIHFTEPILQNNLEASTEWPTNQQNEHLHYNGLSDGSSDSSGNAISKQFDEAISIPTPIEEHNIESITVIETSSKNPLTPSIEDQTFQFETSTEKPSGRSSEDETTPALVYTLIEAAELTTEFARHVDSFRAARDEATAISDEIISTAAAGRSFNAIVAEGLGKPLPTRSVGDEPSSSSYSSEDKTTTVVVLCSSAAIIFIAFSVAMYLITFQRQHGTLDIEMQEQECGKDDLEEDEDAETRVTLLNQLPQADSDTHSFE